MTTLKEIADLANVSISTASRALNDSSLVNEQTKWRVREAATQLNYIPNLNAASLRTGRSDIVAYAVPRLESGQDSLHLEILGQLERYAAMQRHKILLVTYPADQQIGKFLQILERDSRTGGMLLFGDVFDADRVKAYLAARYPLVVVNAYPDDWEDWGALPCVGLDNLELGYLAAKHLLWLGHRRLAWIGNEQTREGLQRREGFRRALKEAGAALREDWVRGVNPDNEIDDGARVAYELLGGNGDAPTAVVAGDDYVALGVMKAARMLGCGVPEDVSVIGAGDADWAEPMNPSLTTMDTKTKTMGRTAADLLLRLMRGETLQKHDLQIKLRPELIVRASVKSPK